MTRKLLLVLITAFLWFPKPLAMAGTAQTYFRKRPKLVILLVIDQFRADYITRFQEKFGKDGFNRLMNNGAYMPWAQYGILHSMTGPGHATLSTGAYPYQMGIPLNTWYDQTKKSWVYCVEDPSTPWVGAEAPNSHVGTSPKNLVGSTFGDELKNAGRGSKVVSLALKDRAAILMGGHRADAALWFDDRTFKWVSSKYYFKDGHLPAWVDRLNDSIQQTSGNVLSWTIDKMNEKATGPLAPQKMLAGDGFLPNPESLKIGKDWPHAAPFGKKAALYLPYGLDLTEQMAESAIRGFDLGKDAATDFLAVSFSTHDYLGHAYGPESREMEQLTLAEDRVLARFLKFLDHQITGGTRDVVIALSADHGIAPNPDTLLPKGQEAGRIDEGEIAGRISQRLNARFGKPTADWIPFRTDLNFWVSREAIEQRKADLKQVLAEASEELRTTHGIAQVFTLSDYKEGHLPPGMFRTLADRTYIPGVSGDLVAIPKPFFFPLDVEAVEHMTGYSYDRTVPLILMGPGIKKGVYSSQVSVIDLAPTLSFLSAVLPPSGSEGRVLSEIIE